MNAITYRPPSEAELDTAIARLELLLTLARGNLEAGGRDPAGARVLVHDLMLDLGARRVPVWRFRQLLNVLEARRLVAIDPPFIAPAGERAGQREAVRA